MYVAVEIWVTAMQTRVSQQKVVIVVREMAAL